MLVLKIPEVIAAFLILIIGRYVVRLLLKIVDSRFQRRNVDISIRGFISSLLRFVLYALLILTVASTVGIQTTSFIAALSAFLIGCRHGVAGKFVQFCRGCANSVV